MISASDVDSFHDLHYQVFHKKQSQFDIEKLPLTTAIKRHILRAYLQCHLWFHSAFTEEIKWDPFMYGYTEENEDLQPVVTVGSCITEEFPVP